MYQEKAARCLALAGTLALVLTGCTSLRQLTGTNALRNSIKQKFHIEEVLVDLRETDLMVISCINSGWEDQPSSAKREQAQRIGTFAREHYKEIDPIKRIAVLFIKETKGSVLRTDRELAGSYLFERNTMREPVALPPPPAAAETRPRVVYSNERNETVVSGSSVLLYGRQLEDGTTRNGLQLLPHFVVKGKLPQSPAKVDLDFAAFSPEAIYQADHRVEITADGALLAKGEAQFVSAGDQIDGQVAEFFTIKLAFGHFKQLASSRQATIRLGERSVELKAAQLRQLSDLVEAAETEP